MRRYVIIGTGVAAISAVEAIRQQDASGEVLLVGDEPERYYSRPGLAYFLTAEIPEHFLYPFTKEEYRSLKITNWQGRVARLDPAGHQAVLEGGTALPYDRLLIATGAHASRPSVAGIDLEGVVKLDTLADARQILSLAKKAQSAVVVGGGITALELVEGLAHCKVETHYFLRGDRYWSNVLDEPESRLVERRLGEEGVRLHFNTELDEIIGQKGHVSGVRAKGAKDILACQMVAIAIGITPRKDLAVACGLKTERGILVDEYLQTSAADIYAAGDVAQVFDPLTGTYNLDSLWSTARDQGQAAGGNMSGAPQVYRKALSGNVTRLAGLTTTLLGMVGAGRRDSDLTAIARGDSESWRQAPDAVAVETDETENRLRLQVGPRTLLGAVVMGSQTYSPALEDLVRHQVDISSIRSALLQPGARLGELVTQVWMEWRQILETQQP